jgi:hypothetical protein
MEHGRSNKDSLVDEEDTQSDTPILSRIVTQGDDATTLQRITCKASLVDWVDETVGDMHIGKRKRKTMTKKGKYKNRREWLKAMRRLPVRKVAQNTKNPTLALLPSILMMGGMMLANTVLNHLVVLHSSQVTSTT